MIFLPTLHGGGAQRVFLTLASELQKYDQRVKIIIAGKPDVLSELAKELWGDEVI